MGHSNDSQVRGPEITDFVHQRMLKSSISCTSVALHSGAQVKLILHPADADDGIVFHRTDISDRDARIEALWSNVSDTQLCTAISNAEGVSVATIEHLMAALAGCGTAYLGWAFGEKAWTFLLVFARFPCVHMIN